MTSDHCVSLSVLLCCKLCVRCVDAVQPACLPEAGDDPPAGRKCFIAGWGQDAEDGDDNH